MNTPLKNPAAEILSSIAMAPSLRERLKQFLAESDGDRELAAVLEAPIERIRMKLYACLADSELGKEILERMMSEDFFQSDLPPARQTEILRAFLEDLPGFSTYLRTIKAAKPRGESIELKKPLWVAPATTSPVTLQYKSQDAVLEKSAQLMKLGLPFEVLDDNKIIIYGWRLSFAFYKPMCSYKKVHGTCTFCDLSHKTSSTPDSVSADDQLAALHDALSQARAMQIPPLVFEILPDGSFLHDNEIPEETRIRVIRRLSEEESVHRVAIETRTEHFDPEKIGRILSNLRPDQQLNIYFGLETTDEFVGAVINKKGYCYREFEEAVMLLKNRLPEEDLQRISISVYHLIKPSYLTERESLHAALQMAIRVRELSLRAGIRIDVKYEPAIISKNTLQDYLFSQTDPETRERRYMPPSYFTVAEIIASLAELDLHDIAKFGQRDDIDDYRTVAMVPLIDDDKMFSPFDFMVYNAVQRFNTRHDLRTFLFDMKIPIQNSPEFKKWELEMYGHEGGSALSRMSGLEFQRPLTDTESEREEFQKRVWRVCDEIEYNPELSERMLRLGESGKDWATTTVSDFFARSGITLYQVKTPVLVDPGMGTDARLSDEFSHDSLRNCSLKAAYQIEVVILNEERFPQSVWVKIPLVPSRLQKFDFIYGGGES